VLAREQVDKHRNPPLSGQRARQHLTLIVAPLAQTLFSKRNRDEHRRSVSPGLQFRHRGCQVVGDPRQAGVFQGVDGRTGVLIEPDRGPHRSERGRPLDAEPAGAEVGLGLAAALAPGWPDGLPALAADRADEPAGLARCQQRMAQQALRGEEELLNSRMSNDQRPTSYARSARWTAARMTSVGAAVPGKNRSNAAAPCCTSISRPSAASMPRSRSARTHLVSPGA